MSLLGLGGLRSSLRSCKGRISSSESAGVTLIPLSQRAGSYRSIPSTSFRPAHGHTSACGSSLWSSYSLSVEGAADWLAKWRRWHETERKGRCTACEKRTPLGILAAILIRERLRKPAAALSVRTVVRAEDEARAAASAAGESSDDEDGEQGSAAFHPRRT